MIRSAFAWCLCAMLLLQAAWMCAVPTFRGPDEIDHVYRASSVALGELLPADTPADTLAVLRADGALVEQARPTCEVLREDFDPSVCRPTSRLPDGTVEVPSGAGRYLPAYYLAVSPALAGDAGDATPWLLRGLSAVLCALVLAWSWTLGMRARSTRWGSVVMGLAMTPAVVFASVVVAPNGLHYAAGLLLWTALLAFQRSEVPRSGPVVAAGVAAATLVLSHTTGVVWLGLIGLAWLIQLRGPRLRVLHRTARSGAVSALLVVAAVAVSLGWILLFAPNTPTSGEPLVEETKAIGILPHTVLWLFQSVGVMPNRFDILWPLLYAVWLLPLGALFVVGWRSAHRQRRLAIAFVLVCTATVPAVATWLTYDDLGVAWQGRYSLPLLFGALLMAGEAVAEAGRRLTSTHVAVALAALGAGQYAFVLCLGLRESRGPYADERPWTLLLWVVAPLLVTAACACLHRAQALAVREGQDQRAGGPVSVQAE